MTIRIPKNTYGITPGIYKDVTQEAIDYKAAFEAEIEANKTYSEKRLEEYPDYKEFLDAQVKLNSGDSALQTEGQAQLDKYVSDCIAVKLKYPKPE